MNCQTVKEGIDCVFMSKRGCEFNGGMCHTVIEECDGCNKIVEFPTGKYCSSAADPAAKWVRGLCNLATHIKKEEKVEALKVNPLKASKRAAGNI